jgi:hypothetical protein
MKKQVFMADNPIDAYFIKGLLEAQGVAAEIREEGMIGDYPSIWVSAGADYELARRVISTVPPEQAVVETLGELWLCARCGEAIEPQFTECWRCGTSQSTA